MSEDMQDDGLSKLLDSRPGLVIRLHDISNELLRIIGRVVRDGDVATEPLLHMVLIHDKQFMPPVHSVEVRFCLVYLRRELEIYEVKRPHGRPRTAYALTHTARRQR